MGDDYALYRYFDREDKLLYVGISGDLAVRDTSHITRSRWMQLVAGSTVERHGALQKVKEAERKAIENEHPLFNRQYNDTPEATERLRLYLVEIGRLDLLHPDARTSSPSDRGVTDATSLSGDGYQFEVHHGEGVVLRISGPGWNVVMKLGSATTFDLSDALKHHAFEDAFAFMRQIPAVVDAAAYERWNREPE